MKKFKKGFYQNVSTDTRSYKGEPYFFAIPGTKFNPLKHIEPIINHKSLEIVSYQSSKENEVVVEKLRGINPKVQFNAQDDLVSYFQECAKDHRLKWGKNADHKLIAISGSNGKTTNKEMLYYILDELYPGKVIKTLSNNNNHLGVPLTLFSIGPETQFAIVELGSNAPGEIQKLLDISCPDSALVTNVGYTHMEFFKDLDAVFKEESLPYQHISHKHDNFFLINEMDEYLAQLKIRKQDKTIGVSGNDFDITINNNNVGFTKPFQNIIHNQALIGRHNYTNLALSVATAYLLAPDKIKEIIQAAENFKPGLNRSEWKNYRGVSVFLDAYNANPSSMIASLEGFKEFNAGKSLVVLGDMNELGDYTEEGHRKVATFLRECHFEHVVFIGRFRKFYLAEYPFAEQFETWKEFKPNFEERCTEFKSIFLKASRTLQLERLIDIN